ncbi:MAG: ABC transporter permease [Rhodospirillaceae bacterium]|nr:ABC transporter permease [Rhodospirillaceae bacterium]
MAEATAGGGKTAQQMSAAAKIPLDPLAQASSRHDLAKLKNLVNLEIIIAFTLFTLVCIVAIFGTFLQTHDPMQGDLMARFTPVGEKGYLLGSDHLGRDLWSRAVAGLQWSMSCALAANSINLVIGATLGLLAAEREGWPRTIARQITDTLQSFPFLVVAIVVVVIVGHGYWPLVLTLGFLAWPVFMRVVYAEASSIFQRDYVKAARIAGVSRARIMFSHVLPGVRASLFVVFAFHFAGLLIAESALSFLGIGAPLGVPTWGNILAESRQYLLRAPWMLMVPAGAIVIAVITMNLVGDGIAGISRKSGRSIDV